MNYLWDVKKSVCVFLAAERYHLGFLQEVKHDVASLIFEEKLNAKLLFVAIKMSFIL